MANHAAHASPGHNLEVLFDDSGAVLARTTKPVAAGEELCLCYHEEVILTTAPELTPDSVDFPLKSPDLRGNQDTAAHMFSKYGIGSPPQSREQVSFYTYK